MPLEFFREGGQMQRSASQETCHRVVRPGPGSALRTETYGVSMKRHEVRPPPCAIREPVVSTARVGARAKIDIVPNDKAPSILLLAGNWRAG